MADLYDVPPALGMPRFRCARRSHRMVSHDTLVQPAEGHVSLEWLEKTTFVELGPIAGPLKSDLAGLRDW
jgi:hypothetical protein